MNLQQKYDQLKYSICEIAGITEAQFNTSRIFPVAFYRAIVANELIRAGYRYVSIGELLGRNHSTISMMCHKLNEVIDLPQYRKVKEVYTKLKQYNYAQKSIQ